MADRVYTRNPLKGVTVPRYFIEDFATGIWKKLFVKSALIKYFHLESLEYVVACVGNGWKNFRILTQIVDGSYKSVASGWFFS